MLSYGQAWANVSNTPFRRYKHWVHEGGISTPLIAHWPKGIASRGVITHQPGHVIDVMPTLIELAGGTYQSKSEEDANLPAMPGRSLVPTLKQPEVMTPRSASRNGTYAARERGEAP